MGDRFQNAILAVIQPNELPIIADVCQTMADERYPNIHKETISKSDVLVVREKPIAHMNGVNRILFPSP